MKTLYIDCGCGAAGDMLTAALLQLVPDRKDALAQLNTMGIPDVSYSADIALKCGISGLHVTVKCGGTEESEDMYGHHIQSKPKDIERIVDGLNIPENIKVDIRNIYGILAEAESKVHNVPMEYIHFHEVGTLDALADIAAVCFLMDCIGADRILASPVCVGRGTVKCAHGVLPVPAPATAEILKGVPCYASSFDGELCTPTGAALLKYFAADFCDMPAMVTQSIGYGMGKKDFPRANCVRMLLGETPAFGDTVCELCCNVDDMTAEEIGFALSEFMDGGALDAYTLPIGMKKSRPGTMICVMCKEADRDKFVGLIFRHTTTLGVRENVSRRYTMQRRTETAETPYGPVRRKISQGFGVTREKLEYEDLAKIAREHDLSLAQVRKMISAEEK